MVIHLTPLKRNQLLDLEALIESVIQTSCSSPTSSSLLGSSSGLGSNNNISANSVHERRQNGDVKNRNGVLDPTPLVEHPFSYGSFCDVFEDPATRDAWRLHDKMLYLVWWTHRPPHCTECGMHDAWIPSADSEMICWHCGAGAGTTSVNDVVEDLPGMDNDNDNDDDGGNEGNHHNFAGENDENDDGAGAGSSAGGPIALYTFFFEWLARVRLAEGGKGIVVPTGPGLAAVLRAAHDLSQLFVVPGLPRGGAGIVRGGALYLSLVLHRYPAPFPLFCHAAWGPAGAQAQRRAPCSGGAPPLFQSAEAREELQWVDVELLAAFIGVALSDFFEGPQVAMQYLQNVMAVAADFAVPSVLWHPQRAEGRAQYIQQQLRQRRVAALSSSSHSSNVPPSYAHTSLPIWASPSGGLAPEHTAMLVALELARSVDAQPCAAPHAERIGQWLDRMGLYPSRGTVYSRAASGTAQCPAAAEDNKWAIGPLTTADSLFAGDFCLILPSSPCANALLHVFARVFSMTALEIADMAMRSGIYDGPTRFFDVLREAAQAGDYSRMPLARRRSPIASKWASTYFALHSEDRLPLLAALQHVRGAVTRDGEVPAARVVQRILRKHQAAQRYQFNYAIRVSPTEESGWQQSQQQQQQQQQQQLQGLYFLSYVTERLAVFTGVRSARKTLTFDNETERMTFCVIGSREQYVESLDAQFAGPVVVHVETESAKCTIDCVCHGIGAVGWQTAVRNFDRCGRVRRRMRVPMLASRLDALASVREATAAASHHTGSAHLGLNFAAGGMSVRESARGNVSTTLLGWGDTEALLTTALPVTIDAAGLRCEVQRNILSLPRPSLVLGLSENRVTALYASLVALLEHVEQQIARRRAGLPVNSSLRIALGQSWVDVMLTTDIANECVADDNEEKEAVLQKGCTLPASTASEQQQYQYQQQQQHQSFHTALGVVPSYRDVLLGSHSAGRVVPAGRGRHHSHQRQRRHGSQPRHRDSAFSVSGSPHHHHHHSDSNGGSPAKGNNSAHAGESFHLFCAEECRRRLHRLLQFVAAYRVSTSAGQRGDHSPGPSFKPQPQQPQQSQQQQQRTPRAAALRNGLLAPPPPLSLSSNAKPNTPPALHPSSPAMRAAGRSPELGCATPPKVQQHNNYHQNHHRRRRASRSDGPADSSDEGEAGRYSSGRKRDRDNSDDVVAVDNGNDSGRANNQEQRQRHQQRTSVSHSEMSSDSDGGQSRRQRPKGNRGY